MHELALEIRPTVQVDLVGHLKQGNLYVENDPRCDAYFCSVTHQPHNIP